MELSQQTITLLIGIGSLVTMVITVVMSIKKPQFKSELIDAVFAEKFKNLETNTHEKINTLEKVVINLRDNHIHTIESKLDQHIKDNQLNAESNIRQMTRIETLLEQVIRK